MSGSGCVITIGSIIAEVAGSTSGFVQLRLGASILTEEPSVKVALKIIGEGDGGSAMKEYLVAGTATADSPQVLREIVLDADLFSAIRKWRVAGIVCYAAADPRNRCECIPSDLFTPSAAPAFAS